MSETWCIVTGASSGIGRAITVHFAEKGMHVFAVARREDKLKETCAAAEGQRAVPIVADISTKEGRQRVLDAVVARGQEIKYLIHNAGVSGTTKALDMTEDIWRQGFEINVHAPFFLSQLIVPHMAEHSRILHVSSGAAHFAIEGKMRYCVTKAALHMLYKCLNKEFAKMKIAVGSVRPGTVESAMQVASRSLGDEFKDLREKFQGFKDKEFKGTKHPHRPPVGGLDTALNVAYFLDFLLRATSENEFGEKEWDIRDESHFSRWIKE
eukprot:CAMPEP_0184523068 /NCGR_PEP_ID=MMETSP0198_2-20121128/8663_1 /TAXON_ID=1112570 /ORGANISM="Thraustochytrium sp., Strain LLF1b" /LENGTH=266 /DNA_ID=CAMNT_0026914027 /DNA_START=30 /DNA_END=830 /DNA_ORIENTATION=-